MYGFFEYFDEKKKNTPYESAEEHRSELFLLLDMMLEYFLRDKGARCKEGTWHSRASRVSEEELQDYFDLPPEMRPEDLQCADAIADAKEAMTFIKGREALTKDAFLPFRELRERLSLSFPEELAVLVAASVRWELRYLRIYRFIQDDYTLQFPTVGTMAALMAFLGYTAEETEDLFAPDRTLWTFLFDKRGDAAIKRYPALMEPLYLSDTAYAYLCGEEGAGDLPIRVDQEPREIEGFFFDILPTLARETETKEKAVFRYLESSDPEDAAAALTMLAARQGVPFYELDTEHLIGAERMLPAVLFYFRMHDGVILLKEQHSEKEEADDVTEQGRTLTLSTLLPIFVKHLPGRIIYLCGEKKLPPLSVSADCIPAVLSLPLPDVKERIRIWQYFLAVERIILEERIDIFDVADCHELSFSAIKRIMRQARETMDALGLTTLSRPLLQDLLFRLNTSHFEHLATAVNAHYTWDDIFLGTAEKKRLQAACDRFRLRNRVGAEWGINKKNAYGNAVIILMYGPPGTGKTMAAQAIANEIMTPLYRVDVSQIFSKYIGETQKNLSRIFDEAEKRSVVLFFDEADALFTKRTEIKDSHDKYANSDTSFLLQKVEEYSGITILATNSYQSFDSAFMRRLTYVVHFERPDVATREKMWRTMLPEEVPMDADVDYAFLAERFTELTGSNIKSILLTAAYFAGAEKRSVAMRDIILATRYEFEKLGRLINSEEFGKYAMFIQET